MGTWSSYIFPGLAWQGAKKYAIAKKTRRFSFQLKNIMWLSREHMKQLIAPLRPDNKLIFGPVPSAPMSDLSLGGRHWILTVASWLCKTAWRWIAVWIGNVHRREIALPAHLQSGASSVEKPDVIAPKLRHVQHVTNGISRENVMIGATCWATSIKDSWLEILLPLPLRLPVLACSHAPSAPAALSC